MFLDIEEIRDKDNEKQIEGEKVIEILTTSTVLHSRAALSLLVYLPF